jgi:putative transposase
MFRCLLWAIAAAVRPKALLIADNLCLRQQLLVLKRRKPRPRLKDGDRCFWVLACRWFVGWQTSLLIVKPETVLRWHRRGWRTYWRRRSSHKGKPGRRPIAPELRALIRRMSIENPLWGQRRIQAELARIRFKVSARTVAKYMQRTNRRGPPTTWRSFLRQHASTVWACDFFCVQTKVLAEYVGYFNHWRPHRSIGQRAPCAPVPFAPHRSVQAGKIIAIPVLGGLHHVYQQAA